MEEKKPEEEEDEEMKKYMEQLEKEMDKLC